MGKGPEQTLLQKGHTKGPDTYERMPASLALREMQIKTIMRYHLNLSEWPSSTNQQTSVGEVVEKREPYCTVGGNADWCSHCGKQYGISSEN